MINLDNDLLNCLQCITERTTYHSMPTNLVGFDESIASLNEILLDSVQEKKSNIVLVTGSPSSGKTTLVKHCIGTLDSEKYTLVWLKGMIHCKDAFALKEIIKSLHLMKPLQNLVVGGVNRMTTSEMTECIKISLGSMRGEDIVNQRFSSLPRHPKPLIVVMDDFEFMVSRQQKKQNLLYNLLDLSHDKTVSLTLIGITSQQEIQNSLEKRLKSRFSQSRIKVPQLTFEEMMTVIKNILTIPESNLSKEWNENINNLLLDKDILKELNYLHDINPSFPQFFKLINQCLFNVDNENRFLTKKMIMTTLKNSQRTWIYEVLMSLTVLEFTILACILSISRKRKEYPSVITFSQLYEIEYKQLSSSFYKISDTLSKLSCLAGIQTLLKYRLIKQEGTNFGEFIQFRLTMIDVALCETVSKERSDCPAALQSFIRSWLQ